jgi:hypothetical protein
MPAGTLKLKRTVCIIIKYKGAVNMETHIFSKHLIERHLLPIPSPHLLETPCEHFIIIEVRPQKQSLRSPAIEGYVQVEDGDAHLPEDFNPLVSLGVTVGEAVVGC